MFTISLLKTLREKEKLLLTSNCSFPHSVFYPFLELFAIFIELEIVVCKLFEFGRVWNLSLGKGLNPILAELCSSYSIQIAGSLNHVYSKQYLAVFILFISINPFPNKALFLRVCSTSVLKTPWEKQKLLVRCVCPQFFLSFWKLSSSSFIWNCLQTLSVWKSLKFVIWERVKSL